MLGYSEAATLDIEHALKDARETGHASTSMFALSHASLAQSCAGNRGSVGACR